MTSPINQQPGYAGGSFVYFSKYRPIPNSAEPNAADSFVAHLHSLALESQVCFFAAKAIIL